MSAALTSEMAMQITHRIEKSFMGRTVVMQATASAPASSTVVPSLQTRVVR